MSTNGKDRERLGDVLLREGLITPDQLAAVVQSQQSSQRMLGELLVEQQILQPAMLVRVLARMLGMPGVLLRHGLIDPKVFKLVGAEDAQRLKALPLFKVRDTLTVAMAEPQSLPSIDRLRTLTGCRIRPVLALEANIVEFIKKYMGGAVSVDAFLTSLSEQDVEVVERECIDEGPQTDLDKLVVGSPIINLVNVAMLTAVRDGASDIHTGSAPESHNRIALRCMELLDSL